MDFDPSFHDEFIDLFRAGSVGGHHAPVCRIEIEEEISDNMNLKEARDLYTEQGKLLADALFGSLPGGTIDALFCEIMDRKRSLLRIPFN